MTKFTFSVARHSSCTQGCSGGWFSLSNCWQSTWVKQDLIPGQNVKEFSPHLFRAKSHSFFSPLAIAMQYISSLKFTLTLEQEAIVFLGVLVFCIDSRILMIWVRRSHPVAETLHCLLQTVLASHIARPTHLGNTDLRLKIYFIRLSPTTFFRNKILKWSSGRGA